MYHGRCEYYDEDLTLTTGTVHQAIIQDARNACMERALVLGISTNDVPDALWWRASRYDLEEFKSFIENYLLIGAYDVQRFVNTSLETNGNYDAILASTNYPAGDWARVTYSKESLLDDCSLQTNYFDYTPWRSLLSCSNGWQGVKVCLEKLYVIPNDSLGEVTLGLHEYPYGFHHWGDDTNWVSAKAEADTTFFTNRLNIGRDYNWGVWTPIDSDFSGYRYIEGVLMQAQLGVTNFNAECSWYVYTEKPEGGEAPFESVYDSFGNGWTDSNRCFATSTIVYGTNIVKVTCGNTNHTLNTWCDEPPTTNDNLRGWTFDINNDGWRLYDYSVTNGFNYID